LRSQNHILSIVCLFFEGVRLSGTAPDDTHAARQRTGRMWTGRYNSPVSRDSDGTDGAFGTRVFRNQWEKGFTAPVTALHHGFRDSPPTPCCLARLARACQYVQSCVGHGHRHPRGRQLVPMPLLDGTGLRGEPFMVSIALPSENGRFSSAEDGRSPQLARPQTEQQRKLVSPDSKNPRLGIRGSCWDRAFPSSKRDEWGSATGMPVLARRGRSFVSPCYIMVDTLIMVRNGILRDRQETDRTTNFRRLPPNICRRIVAFGILGTIEHNSRPEKRTRWAGWCHTTRKPRSTKVREEVVTADNFRYTINLQLFGGIRHPSEGKV